MRKGTSYHLTLIEAKVLGISAKQRMRCAGISVLFILAMHFFPVVAAAEEWKGTLADGKTVTEADIRSILAQHRRWLETNKKEGQKANFRGANLNGIFLFDRDLTEADLEHAILSKANLQRANLTGANLCWADLSGADLKDACFTGSDLKFAIYEPKAETSPLLLSLAMARNLQWLTYNTSPHGLIELREAFKKAGLRDQERMITFAIEHTKRIKLTSADPFSFLFSKFKEQQGSKKGQASFLERLGLEVLGWIYYIFIELTCEYGMSPWRPLFLLLVLIPFFSALYVLFLWKGGRDGIWKVWNPERMRKNHGETTPRRPVRLRGASAIPVGLYFSVLSAFSIGWRELNVGVWIARLQRYEYNYRATGWARTVSGFQSLLSVYFLALWALTYFSRPFE
jgi:hypothetical protein